MKKPGLAKPTAMGSGNRRQCGSGPRRLAGKREGRLHRGRPLHDGLEQVAPRLQHEHGRRARQRLVRGVHLEFSRIPVALDDALQIARLLVERDHVGVRGEVVGLGLSQQAKRFLDSAKTSYTSA